MEGKNGIQTKISDRDVVSKVILKMNSNIVVHSDT